MPRASVATITSAKPGCRRRRRAASRTSWPIWSAQRGTHTAPRDGFRQAAEKRTHGEIPERQRCQAGGHVQLAERARQEPTAGHGERSASLQEETDPTELVAQSLPQSFAAQPTRKQKLNTGSHPHGGERHRSALEQTKRGSADGAKHRRGKAECIQRDKETDEDERREAGEPLYPFPHFVGRH